MMRYRKVKAGKKTLEAFCFSLGAKNLIVIKGKKGYVACGYVNVKVADTFNDAACIVTGVTTITDACNARIQSLTKKAKALGLYKNQPIKDVLSIIA